MVNLDFDPLDRLLTVSGDGFYLVMGFTDNDLALLRRGDLGLWAERRSLRSGTVLEKPVFWSLDPGMSTVSALVGGDDETWEVSATFPHALLVAALGEAGCA